MADWIRMPFGVVSGVGLGMGVLDFSGDHRRGRGCLGGEFAASHCNQCCVGCWWNPIHNLLMTHLNGWQWLIWN